MPVPIAVMIAWISSFERILSIRARSTFRILPLSGRIAWYARSRACFALPPAESPSTRYISHIEGSEIEQSASLPGSTPPSSALFLRARSRALRAASRARAAWSDFSMIALAAFGFSSRKIARCSLTTASTAPAHLGVAELGLGLALELRLHDPHAQHAGEPLAHVVAGEVLVLLEDAVAAGVVVDRARERRLEARQVHAALVGVDVVDERVRVLAEALVVLERELDLRLRLLDLEVADLVVERLAGHPVGTSDVLGEPPSYW
jgi:hypothetical protein